MTVADLLEEIEMWRSMYPNIETYRVVIKKKKKLKTLTNTNVQAGTGGTSFRLSS